jgi:branched-subunit amino acid ABC-type transport system permease component
MQFWIIQGLNSLSLGGLLFLLSSGFSLIFGLMRLANLTHGAFFMLGTYIAATAMRAYDGLNLWLMVIAAGFAVAALGGLFERLVLTRLKTNPLGQVLVTLGMSFIISDACLMLWGAIPFQCQPRKICKCQPAFSALCSQPIASCWSDWRSSQLSRSISCWNVPGSAP